MQLNHSYCDLKCLYPPVNKHTGGYKGLYGEYKIWGFLHVIAKFTSFGIFTDNLGQQSHRDKFACQISTAGWLTTSCLYYSGGSDHLAV